MKEQITEYLKNKWKNLIIMNIILFIIFYIILVVPLRLYFDIPLKGSYDGFNHGYFMKKVTEVEENVFLKQLFNIGLDDKYVNFNKEIRIGVSGQLKKQPLFSFGKEEYLYHNAFVTFTGHLENDASKNIFLKELGFSESEIEEDKSLYNIGNSYVLFENNNDFSLCIKVKLDIEEYYSKHLSVGSTLSSLQEENSQLGYSWTISRIINKKVFFQKFLIMLLEIIIIIFINIFYILKSREKK